MSKPRLLIFDIETSPHSVFVWDMKPNYISTEQMIQQGRVLCFSWKWLGDKSTQFCGGFEGKRSYERMVRKAHALLTEADGVIHFNGDRFDIPMLHKEMVELGMTPPAPSVSHDLLKVVRQKFRFPSNKLSYVAKRLGLGSKVHHKGLELWIKCMAGDRRAWAKMTQYNKQDVVLTERLYLKLRPWMEMHLDLGLWMEDDKIVCPKCQGDRLLSSGLFPIRGGGGTYRRWRCQKCGAWPRERIQSTPEHRKGRGLA